MGKPGVNASNGLLGILLIDLVAGLVAFFRNGKHARRREGLQRIARLRMNHARAKPEIIGAIHKGDRSYQDHNNAFEKVARRDQANNSLPAL